MWHALAALLLLFQPQQLDGPLIGQPRGILIAPGHTKHIIAHIRTDAAVPQVCANILEQQAKQGKPDQRTGRELWDYQAYIYWCERYNIQPDWIPTGPIEVE